MEPLSFDRARIDFGDFDGMYFLTASNVKMLNFVIDSLDKKRKIKNNRCGSGLTK